MTGKSPFPYHLLVHFLAQQEVGRSAMVHADHVAIGCLNCHIGDEEHHMGNHTEARHGVGWDGHGFGFSGV